MMINLIRLKVELVDFSGNRKTRCSSFDADNSIYDMFRHFEALKESYREKYAFVNLVLEGYETNLFRFIPLMWYTSNIEKGVELDALERYERKRLDEERRKTAIQG